MSIKVLREVWRIKRRSNDGSVLETEYVEDRWVTIAGLGDRPDDDPDLMWVVKSSQYVAPTIKRERPAQ